MNRFSIFLVRFYHMVFRSNTASCRFEPTCSQYLIDAAQKYGIFIGLAKTTQRILSCHPLSKRPFYDPA